MSWLHCMWGVGASVGPYIMGAALSSRAGWQTGYRVDQRDADGADDRHFC